MKLCSLFYKDMSTTYNKAFPYARWSRKRGNDKRWITTALKVSIKEKHKLYQKCIFIQTPVNAKLYKPFKNRLKTLIRKAEINYYLEAFNPIQAGVFWKHIGWGAHYLWSNYNQTWHGGTLRQNLSKAIKMLLMSSLGGKYDVIKLFLVWFQVKIRVFLFCVQLSWNLAHGSILRRWFRIQARKSDINTFWRRKCHFWNFCPSAPWQKCCHGLVWWNDALYNYTKNQKVSLVYYKPFLYSKEETCRGAQCAPTSLNRVNDKSIALKNCGNNLVT